MPIAVGAILESRFSHAGRVSRGRRLFRVAFMIGLLLILKLILVVHPGWFCFSSRLMAWLITQSPCRTGATSGVEARMHQVIWDWPQWLFTMETMMIKGEGGRRVTTLVGQPSERELE
jgi:hypothetical protein